MQLSPLQSENLANSLRRHISGEVLCDDYRRALYSTDASLYQIQPLAVVVPKSREDVAACVAIAAEHRAPLVARGSGTSLSGQSIGAGIVVDFSKYLNRIVDLDAGSRTARVEPGVVLDQLNAAAAPHRLQFGPDVATSNRANIAGMIGNNSAGSRSIRHGKTVDNVQELSVLSSDATPATLRPLTAEQLHAEQGRGDRWGAIYRAIARIVDAEHEEIVARFPPILRRVSGYNLDEFVPECRDRFPVPPNVERIRRSEAERFPGANFNLSKLIVGAEGTLACVTEAVVHLVPLPARRGVIVLHFDSLEAAVAAVGPVLACRPSAAELLDGQIIRLAEKSLEYRHYLDFVVGKPESLLLVEFSGETDEEIRRSAADLADRVRWLPGLFHTLEALDRERCNHIWACRKASLPLLYGVPGVRKPIAFVEDTAVDPSRLVEFVARFREIIARAGTVGAFYGHASVGCLHIRPMLDAADRGDRALIAKISTEVCELVMEFHGAMSGEHGDGLARSYLNERLFGPRLYAAFKQVKAAFDPAGILNPGKVVDGPGPLENLRQGGGYRPLEITTTFDFRREGGFLRAAEMCNGSGVCRKRATGTMCPSFMATGDEEHSTRGRANALRLVLSGALPPAELTGRKLYDTFDLCLQCKGCKAECPSNVDVAKLKAEFLHKYHAEHGVPLAARLMGDVARLNRWGSALAPLSNWARNIPGAAMLLQRIAGIDSRRPLPRFERNHFRRWFRRRGRASKASADAAQRGPIVLLDDCLTSFCEPRVNRAAVAVLEAAGYEVHLAGLECCGRAAISNGLLDEARHLAERNISRLLPWAERGVPIVGCEPSCLLALVDDYLDLVPGDDARRVAAAASLIETHLVREKVREKGTRLKKNESRPVFTLLHGHCHQKALIGMGDTVNILTNVLGAAPTLVDSGCCGMAGSFGYEHYDLSMTIGERVLFPAVRTAADAVIVAPGFSCRHQIEHGTGRRAKHPIELVAEMLDDVAPEK
jgi:FAD/FMN-containing dehydrogenase/Fe-S oxidoreductase